MEASLLLAMLVTLACCTPEANGAQDVRIAFEGQGTAGSTKRGLTRSEMRIGLKRTAYDAFRGDVKEYWMNHKGQFPAKIWFHWKVAHKVTKIGFTGVSDHKGFARPPKEFSVIGSMDCETWTILLNVRNADFKTSRSEQTREFKTWNIPSDKQGHYSCVGLSIASTMGRRDRVVALTNIVMWEQLDLDTSPSAGCDKLIAKNFFKPCSKEEEPVCATDKKIYQNTCPFFIAKCKAKDRGEEVEQEKCANHLTEAQRKQLETAFKKFPKNENKGITTAGLQNGLRRHFKKRMPFHVLMGLFRSGDVDQSGEIVFSEFLEAVAKMLLRQTEKNAKFWFRLLNQNRDKVIDANEARSLLTFLGMEIPNNMYDDHDITYAEFVKRLGGKSQRSNCRQAQVESDNPTQREMQVL